MCTGSKVQPLFNRLLSRPGHDPASFVGNPLRGEVPALIRAAFLGLMMAAGAASAQPPPPPGQSQPLYPAPWGKVRVGDGVPVTARPAPPREGRNKCIGVSNIVGAQMFGDRGIELTVKGGARYRMFFASDCPALSFYQGFYYRRAQAGQLCAGRDAVGARSGGECPIASILPVRRFRH